MSESDCQSFFELAPKSLDLQKIQPQEVQKCVNFVKKSLLAQSVRDNSSIHRLEVYRELLSSQFEAFFTRLLEKCMVAEKIFEFEFVLVVLSQFSSSSLTSIRKNLQSLASRKSSGLLNFFVVADKYVKCSFSTSFVQERLKENLGMYKEQLENTAAAVAATSASSNLRLCLLQFFNKRSALIMQQNSTGKFFNSTYS